MVSQKEKAAELLLDKKFDAIAYRTLRELEELVLPERIKLLSKLTKLNQELSTSYHKTLHLEQDTPEARPTVIEMLHDGAMAQSGYDERLNYLHYHLEAVCGLIEETEELNAISEQLGYDRIGVA